MPGHTCGDSILSGSGLLAAHFVPFDWVQPLGIALPAHLPPRGHTVPGASLPARSCEHRKQHRQGAKTWVLDPDPAGAV